MPLPKLIVSMDLEPITDLDTVDNPPITVLDNVFEPITELDNVFEANTNLDTVENLSITDLDSDGLNQNLGFEVMMIFYTYIEVFHLIHIIFLLISFNTKSVISKIFKIENTIIISKEN